MSETKTIAGLNKEIEALKKLLGQNSLSDTACVPDGVKKNEEYMKQPVTIKLFKDNGRYRDDVYVAVNDRSYLIKRGAEVTVPRYVEQALKNSLSQDEYVASLIEGLVDNYQKSSLRQGE